MTSLDRSFEDRLGDALAEPVTSAQRSALDVRMAPTLAGPRRTGLLGGRIVRRGLLLAAALLIALPLMAAAGFFSTEDPFGLADAAEFQAELDVAKAAVALPAGQSWPDFLKVTDPSASYSRGGARSWVESVAMCIWFDEWLGALTTGDPAREQVARAEIESIPTWPSWNSPFWTQSVRDHYGPIISQVSAGDPSGVEAEMQTNCSWTAEN